MKAPPNVLPTSAWQMYRAIVGIGAFCALIIVLVYQGTAARIRDNQARFLDAAIAEVLPAVASTRPISIAADGNLAMAEAAGELPAFVAYGPAGQLLGAAISAQGMGYQDNIRVLYAYSFDDKAIVGFKVLESKETPGLGDRAESDPHFIANFEALDVRLDAAGKALAHPIVTVKQGQKTEPWQIDGITGATITSEAIGRLMADSTARWIPALNAAAPDLAAGGGT